MPKGRTPPTRKVKRRCCEAGECCQAVLSARSRADARDTLRAALTCAVEEQIISCNLITVVKLPASRKYKRRWWTVDEACRFLESARRSGETLYAAFVLILVMGLRKREVLGLTWELIGRSPHHRAWHPENLWLAACRPAFPG
jgi:integrase